MSTPVEESPDTQPQDQVLTHNVTESDVQNIEELVQCKRKALEEQKKITTEERKLRKEMQVSYAV